MSLQLREYQEDCKIKVMEDLTKGKNALCVLAVGSGKTVILSALVKELGGELLILVNKSILIKQIKDTLGKFGIEPAIYSASYGQKNFGPVTVGTIQSVANCKELPKFKYIIVDEAHRFDFEFGQVSGVVKEAQIIGFTATPFNFDGPIYGEDKIFTHKTFERTVREMTEKHFLVPLMYRAPSKEAKIDLENVKKRKDDYVLKDLQEAFTTNEDKVKTQVADALEKSAVYEKILVVTTGIAHAEMVHSYLDDASIIHSKQSKEERNYNMDLFTNGETRILVSVLIVSEGFDFPPAQVLWLMRPTRSPVLYMQACGRVLRTFPGKGHALLLDYGNVVPELGSIYDLDEGKSNQRLKVCTECETYNRPTAKKCYKCGESFEILCPICLKMKDFGTICCTEEDIRKRDALKNLTLTPSELGWIAVNRIMVYEFKAKSGRVWPKADYYMGFTFIASEFFFTMDIDRAREIIPNTTMIKKRKNNKGYTEVYARRID